jgi:diaminopimelate epimerase
VIRVSKLHGTGNDFLVVSALDGTEPPGDAVARALCDRHRGVGADGLLTLLPPRAAGADCSMQLRNADGGLAEMSGNGIRCLAWVARRAGLGDEDAVVVDTDGGQRRVITQFNGTGHGRATVDMGTVTFVPEEIPLRASSALDLDVSYHGTDYHGDAAGVGNPHLVLLVDDVDRARVRQHGPHLEHDERFPNGANVEFTQVVDRDRLRVRIWERGVGETLSCGTGVCAAAAVARRRDLVGDEVSVEVPGGEHTVTLGDTVLLGGDVRHVFDVDVDIDELIASTE